MLNIGSVVQVSGSREQVITRFHTSESIYGKVETPVLEWRVISSKLSPKCEAFISDRAIADRWEAAVERLINERNRGTV